MSFSLDIARWAKKTKSDVNKLKQIVFIQVAGSVIMRTPVDEGRARANWQPTISTMAKSSLITVDPHGAATIAEAEKVAGEAKGDQTLYLTNNLAYIMRLENGWSAQAPGGMVYLTIQEFRRYVKDAVAKLR